MSITGIGQALSTSYLWFAIFAFLNAVGTSGVYPLAFILGTFNVFFKLCARFLIFTLASLVLCARRRNGRSTKA